MALLLGIDLGTSSLKAVLVDSETGRVIRTAIRPTPTDHPRPGWSEHAPEDIWQAVAACIREAAGGQPVAALAISSMAEAGLLVDRENRPVAPVIAWYDRRSEPQAAWIEQQVDMSRLYRITGQRVSPSFGITKLLWLRDNDPAFSRGVRWLPLPSYILWRMCGEQMVDYTIAARTLLFDQNTLGWSKDLLATFGLPEDILPRVAVGGTPVGNVNAEAAQQTGLRQSTLCVLGGHDHLCAALASGAHAPGAVVESTGSANALLMLLPRFLPDPSLAPRGYASYAYLRPGIWALKGGLKSAGSAVEWLARMLSVDGAPDYARLEAAAREGVGRRAGPLWLPHLIGSGTPEGDRFSRAALVGAINEHTSGDLFRGMLESLACWLRHNLEEMTQITGQRTNSMILTGGATRLRLLSQLKADVTGIAMRIPRVEEAASVGAALLAGQGAGIITHLEEATTNLRGDCAEILPDASRAAWYDQLYHTAYRPLYTTLQPVNAALEKLNQQGETGYGPQPNRLE